MNRLDDVMLHAAGTSRDDLTRRDLLERLIEECAEVIQAASKCLLYGYDRNWPGYGVNHEELQHEINDVRSIIFGLELEDESFDPMLKLLKVAKWKKYMRENSEHGPQRVES